MTVENLQGWFEDPFGLHEARYFSAGRPTKLVRDGKAESYDEPPSGTWKPADGVAWTGTFVAGAARLPGDNPVVLPRRRRRAGAFAAAAVLVVAAVIAVVALAGRPGAQVVAGKFAISPVAFIARSAQRTVAQRTAEVRLSETVRAGGRSLLLSGAGEADFSAGSMALSVGFSAAGHSWLEKEILTGGNLYFTMSADGRSLSRLTGGRTWIQMPAGQSRMTIFGGSNPLSVLKVLEQHGNAVRMLGTKLIGGVRCRGYAVTPTRQSLVAAQRRAFAKLGTRPTANLQPPTFVIWFDAQGLVRQMNLTMQVDDFNGMSPVSANLVVTFLHYGSPVKITAPAKSKTISFRSFLRSFGLGHLF